MLWTRRLLGAGALALLFAAVASQSPAREPLPASATEKTLAADTAHLKALFELAKTRKKIENRVKATALLMAQTAQNNLEGENSEKMAAVRAQALKIAEAAAKKDLAAAEAATNALASAKGGDKKPVELAKMHDLELYEIMDLFAGSVGGGMNLEKDIRAAKRTGPTDADSAAIIGVRTAGLADFTMVLTPEFSARKTKADWEKYTQDMKQHSIDIVKEATKPSPDMMKVKQLMSALDASCTNCHNKFRDD